MQKAIPLQGLPVGQVWRHTVIFEEMRTSHVLVSVYLCHAQVMIMQVNHACSDAGSGCMILCSSAQIADCFQA